MHKPIALRGSDRRRLRLQLVRPIEGSLAGLIGIVHWFDDCHSRGRAARDTCDYPDFAGLPWRARLIESYTRELNNICNRGRRAVGAQIEMTMALRRVSALDGVNDAFRSVLLSLQAA
jgi:hypothetical protein